MKLGTALFYFAAMMASTPSSAQDSGSGVARLLRNPQAELNVVAASDSESKFPANNEVERVLKNNPWTPSGPKPNKPTCNNGFDYPAALVPPSQIWVEGFASRLHAKNIQKYETPVQVWQTWRIDQLMWNCISVYHPTALDALTKARPLFSSDEHQDSETRALCIMHGMNKLIPDLVPISADEISTFLTDVGLCADIMSEGDAKTAYEGGDRTPKVLGTIVASHIITDMQNDGWNYEGKDLPDGKSCVANCRPFTGKISVLVYIHIHMVLVGGAHRVMFSV